ncbi:MAG: hypothetical protein AAGI72_20680 [Pseudomonadota bacterium]
MSLALAVTASALAPNLASAATAADFFAIEQIVIDEVNFSGCMARLSPGPQVLGLNCANGFVTFDCKGQLGSARADANAKLAAAQLAFVTDTQLFIRVDDTKKANGFCLAVRVDNTKNAVP